MLSNATSKTERTSDKITILGALYWIKQAWNEVSLECIRNCFSKAGFNFNSMEEDFIEDNNEADFDEIFNSVCQQDNIREPISSEEFINFDDNINWGGNKRCYTISLRPHH